VLLFDALGAAAFLDLLAALLQLGDEFFHPGAGVVGHNVFMIPAFQSVGCNVAGSGTPDCKSL